MIEEIVDLGFDRRAIELEERRRSRERVARHLVLAHLAVADDLSTERTEACRDHVHDR